MIYSLWVFGLRLMRWEIFESGNGSGHKNKRKLREKYKFLKQFECTCLHMGYVDVDGVNSCMKVRMGRVMSGKHF